MFKIKIERGVPVPPRGNHKGVSQGLRQMQPGQSAHIPEEYAKNLNAIAQSVFGVGNYACRREAGGMRVWRLR